MQDLTLDTAEFQRKGGTELAPMSTSQSKSIAFKCAGMVTRKYSRSFCR